MVGVGGEAGGVVLRSRESLGGKYRVYLESLDQEAGVHE